MGGGHNGAARELARRLEQRGCETKVVEFLDAFPGRIGWFLRHAFFFQLRHVRWSYEVLYRWGHRLTWVLAPIDSRLSRRRLSEWIDEFDPDVIVSTYPISSFVLGRLNLAGRLDAPVVTFLTDFAVHALWVHEGVDVHLAVHPLAAQQAFDHRPGRSLAPGPLVHPRFSAPLDRAEARRALGLRDDQIAVLVVAGSWGVGDVDETVDDILSDGRFITIAVCGEDEPLRQALSDAGKGIVLGWTDKMPELMVAADVLVENAGGLTSLEAMTIGLPVVTYRPIPGHGRDNAAAMNQAGVSWYARSKPELIFALERLCEQGEEREQMRQSTRTMFADDPAIEVLAIAHQARAKRSRISTATERASRGSVQQ